MGPSLKYKKRAIFPLNESVLPKMKLLAIALLAIVSLEKGSGHEITGSQGYGSNNYYGSGYDTGYYASGYETGYESNYHHPSYGPPASYGSSNGGTIGNKPSIGYGNIYLSPGQLGRYHNVLIQNYPGMPLVASLYNHFMPHNPYNPMVQIQYHNPNYYGAYDYDSSTTDSPSIAYDFEPITDDSSDHDLGYQSSGSECHDHDHSESPGIEQTTESDLIDSDGQGRMGEEEEYDDDYFWEIGSGGDYEGERSSRWWEDDEEEPESYESTQDPNPIILPGLMHMLG